MIINAEDKLIQSYQKLLNHIEIYYSVDDFVIISDCTEKIKNMK